MNQDLSQTYGRNITFPASQFTQNMQEAIVDNYFNNSGSAYDTIYNASTQPNDTLQATPQLGQQPTEQQAVGQQLAAPSAIQIDQAELNRLRNIEKIVQNTPLFNNQQGMTTPTQGPNDTTNVQPTSVQPTDFDTMMKDFLNPGASGTDAVQPSQSQPQTQTNDPAAQAISELSRDALLAGINPQEVLSFVNTLSNKDIINMFKASQATSSQQQAQPVLQTQPVQPVPYSQQGQQYAQQPYNPMQGQQPYNPTQNQQPINIVDMPSAQQNTSNLAFPNVQRASRSIFE